VIRKLINAAPAFAILALASLTTFAQESAAAAAHSGMSDKAASFWAAGMGMGFAAAIAAFSQSRGIAASVTATARNPQAGGRIFTMMLLGLAFIESLVLFTFLVCYTKILA